MAKRWQREGVLALAFLLALGATFVFAYRAGRRARHLRVENEPIRAWMSIPFIAHTHHLPPAVLFHAIGVEPRMPHDRRSVRRLAHELNRPVPQVIGQLQQAIDAAHPPDGPPR